jgi:hypothetical protein
MDFIDPQVQIYGDLAVGIPLLIDLAESGRFLFRTGHPGTCSEVYARQEGQWRIIHTHWSPI